MNERFWSEELVFKFLPGKLQELKIIFAQHYITLIVILLNKYPSPPSQQVFVIIFYYQAIGEIKMFLHEKYNQPGTSVNMT